MKSRAIPALALLASIVVRQAYATAAPIVAGIQNATANIIPPPATSAHVADEANPSVADTAATEKKVIDKTAKASGLRLESEPIHGSEIVLASAKDYFSQPFSIVPLVVNLTTLQIKPLYAIYQLDVNAIAKGGGFEGAIASGYFDYVIESSGTQIALATVGVDKSGQAIKNGVVFRVPATKQPMPAVVALDQLAALDQVRAGSYVVRLLQVPTNLGGPYFAIWLKSDSGDADDLVYMLPLAPRGFEAHKLYTAPEFLKIDRPEAQKLLNDKSPP